MTLAEMIITLAKKSKLSKASAMKALLMMRATIEEELKKGGKVTLRGFGTFSVAERKARKVRNPRTGQEIVTAAKKVPKFSAGTTLKASVASIEVHKKTD
jgi:DNA-binding protein HU-beta